ncbi:MAG: glycosyltransferase family 4 protein [Kiritimatiellae bacterium]|nr:glycosyltransferase family 4 protein [Kiritimatiellia bacterium]
MKIIMDMRKYDGVVGGVEQGAIQTTRFVASQGNDVILVCKESRKAELANIFKGTERITLHGLPIKTHAISMANVKIDSQILQNMAVEHNVDLIHFFYNWSFPFNRKVPSVLTIHDVIPFTFREAMGFFRNRFLYRPAIRTACRLNDIIATVSEFSRQDIAATVGAPLSKIRVIPNGLREPAPADPVIQKELTKKFNLENGFILNAGGIHERKNIVRLVQAFANLIKTENYKGNLIITGSASGAPYQQKMRKMCDAAISAANLTGKVIFAGFVSEDELDNLLRTADIFIYPSLYEGFGIPILEAMKTGTPVITSNLTAMPEVAGDAALLIDPLDVNDITTKMATLLKDQPLRAELTTKGHKRSSGYSWEKTGEAYLKLYKEIVG